MSIDKISSDEYKHLGDVTSIVFLNDHIISAGGDSKIKVWDKDLKFIKDINIHEAYIYALAIDKDGRLFSSSCDGTVKIIEKPLESDEYSILLKHDKEIESLFVDENNRLYCGDDHGGISIFENLKFKFMMNIVEHVKGLYVEKNFVYSLAQQDLSIHELRGEKYLMKSSIPGMFPVTLFGDVTDGRSKYIAILTKDGKGISVIENGKQYPIVDVCESKHDMIITSIKGFNIFLFSCDYSGKVVKSKMIDGKLKHIASVITNSGCANCIQVINDNLLFVGSSDGTIKRINFK
ncbi:hypothetical protein PVAND_006676 [Polypedilum vanderplanki]|uniref:Uncharacterized protein n=1 Tax=Polypedilum vanderplanki TaxID=319348 RepID=A0A9J6C4P6_POLVA|nr:hypothetical protein PVAND_006676 [Polypedilum vanderplanki]